MGPAKPGQLLANRYRLRSVAGRGGMGVVWLARDELLHRDVAVKEIIWPPQLAAAERQILRQRALREARTAARLDHPNVVGVYDVVEDDARPWIVMRFVPYRSLSDVVREEGPLSPERAARVGLQILAAIRAAHAAGVLHRDVKPGNVLLGPEDGVVLTDFGMATADGNPTLTTAGVLIGSPSYMAPERARGEPATPAADLWSLGATLYGAVEGRPPFDREGTMAVLTAVVGDDPDPPRRAGPLWPVISGLLQKNPGARLDAADAERLLARVAAMHGGVPGQRTVPMEDADLLPTRRVTTPRRGGGPGMAAPILQPGRPGPARTAEIGRAPQRGQPGPGQGPGRHPSGPAGVVAGRPARPDPRRRRHPRRRQLLAAIAGFVTVMALVAVLVLAAEGALGHRAGPPAAPAGSHPGSSAPSASGVPARSSPGRTAPGSSTAPGPLPAGFSWYHDPSGFSIAVPAGWTVSHEGHLVYVRDPGNARFLLVDQTSHPKPDPLADWRQQEAARASTYPGYHRIRLQAVHYAQAERAADWEFTYYRNGQLVHVLNRNVLANPHHAYALYWSTPASEWRASYRFFRTFAATFRPAGGTPGS